MKKSFTKAAMSTLAVSLVAGAMLLSSAPFSASPRDAVAGGHSSSSSSASYVVFARNDLGMHCACPTFAGFLLLPPWNTVRVQVLKKDATVPTIVSSGITVSYSLAEESDTSLPIDPYFSQWITYSPKLFPGFQPIVNGKIQGLAGYGIAGNMNYNSTTLAYEAVGIPAYPVTTGVTAKDVMVDPLGGPNRDPFLTANITVKDSAGATIGTTSCVVPVAFGGCCGCHLDLAAANGYPKTPAGSFALLGKLHGQNTSKIDFNYLDPTGDGTAGPIRCSWCHWDPAMSESAAPGLAAVWPNYVIMPGASFTRTDVKVSQYSFSDVLHRFHVQDPLVLSTYDPNIATDCYKCHPGNGVNCYRSTHIAKTTPNSVSPSPMWCTDCHGNLNQRVAAGQLTQPWKESTLPTCFAPASGITSVFTCHATSAVKDNFTWTSAFAGYFINARAGMRSKILCESCHGSAHAEAPSAQSLDNVENAALQGNAAYTFPAGVDKTYAIGVCNVCHIGKSDNWQGRNAM